MACWLTTIFAAKRCQKDIQHWYGRFILKKLLQKPSKFKGRHENDNVDVDMLYIFFKCSLFIYLTGANKMEHFWKMVKSSMDQ